MQIRKDNHRFLSCFSMRNNSISMTFWKYSMSIAQNSTTIWKKNQRDAKTMNYALWITPTTPLFLRKRLYTKGFTRWGWMRSTPLRPHFNPTLESFRKPSSELCFCKWPAWHYIYNVEFGGCTLWGRMRGSGGVQVGLTDFNPTSPNAHPQGVPEEIVGLWGWVTNSVVTARTLLWL